MIIAAIFIACTVWVIVELVTAKEGYENKKGFHYGKPRAK